MTVAITVTGLVQGVGYRPFVAELAGELELTGEVKNAGGIVTILASGSEQALECFVQRLSSSAPKGASVKEVLVRELPSAGAYTCFSIAESADIEDGIRLLPPDLAICADCERELKDPADRRYRHPFISCVSCGPRFSIMERIPYDRGTVTMRDFPMCKSCDAEYRRKGDRRRHAQTIACKACGPRLKAVAADGTRRQLSVLAEDENALNLAKKILRDGGTVAVKDIGGFHFSFCAGNEAAAVRLREFKNREKKPFAVMFSDVGQLRGYCEVSAEEEKLLCSNPRPIVLLERRRDCAPIAPQVCAGSDRIGAMLPCNPLQILLLEGIGPLVMTSGNRGGEPIITEDEKMRELLLAGCPDLMLTHDREILTPLEDSVCQVTNAGVSVLRRGRGYVPEPVRMSRSLPADSFAAGGDLKAVFALGKGNMAYLSSPFGDLEDYRCEEARGDSVMHMAGLLNVRPLCMAGDMHPLYHSVRERPFGDISRREIQHHHAHILSVMAEHGLDGLVLGVAFDGTGYGTDGSIWGGEFLLCRRNQMERAGCLMPVTMAGGDAAAADAAISLWCYLLAARERGLLTEEELAQAGELTCFIQRERMRETIAAAVALKIRTYECSSMGRLFDAVSALLGVCDHNSYEGECAIRLEQAAHPAVWDGEIRPEDAPVMTGEHGYLLDGVRLIAELFRGRRQGGDVSKFALLFHRTIVYVTAEICIRLRRDHGVSDVALSGGCFCNRILLDETAELLERNGFRVYRNESVPCGDGGLALGQLYALTFEAEADSEKMRE